MDSHRGDGQRVRLGFCASSLCDDRVDVLREAVTIARYAPIRLSFLPKPMGESNGRESSHDRET